MNPDANFDLPAGVPGEPLSLADAAQWLYAEAHYLDLQRWDDWLALYAPDAWFWMPAWVGEHEAGESPERDLSLVYCAARAGLEDRVWRVRSGLSVACEVLPRTAHAISNIVRLSGADTDRVDLLSSWRCDHFDLKRQQSHAFFGRYEHRLRRVPDGWRIAGKKITLLNDRIPTMLDFDGV